MKRNRLILLFCLAILLLPALSSSGAITASLLTPSVQTALAGGRRADVLAVLKERADISGAQQLENQIERGRYVYEQLVRVAQRSQRALRNYLTAHGMRHRAYYLVNMIAIPQADGNLVRELATRPEVARIELNPRVRSRALITEKEPDFSTDQEQTIPWNLKLINADKVWEMGITGEDVVVASADTGIDWTHPALIEHYRGYRGETADHNFNWFDAVEGAPEPHDPDDHGTVTLGVVVGDDGERNRTGVAFGAQWIGCRNMDVGGFGTPEWYIGCMEFFLAPYPIGGDPMKDGDPSKAPQIINNSWGCPPEEGCSPETLKEAVERVRAAGILFVAAVGNEGPICSSVLDPPAIYEAAFTVGATDRNDQIARFSSRGPVTFFGTTQIEPDVSAPGVSIRGPIPGGGYLSVSGTSLAAPHVAGVAALMLSAAPHLRVEIIEELLRQSSEDKFGSDCGGDRPDNTYGWGRIDALAAVKAALETK